MCKNIIKAQIVLREYSIPMIASKTNIPYRKLARSIEKGKQMPIDIGIAICKTITKSDEEAIELFHSFFLTSNVQIMNIQNVS